MEAGSSPDGELQQVDGLRVVVPFSCLQRLADTGLVDVCSLLQQRPQHIHMAILQGTAQIFFMRDFISLHIYLMGYERRSYKFLSLQAGHKKAVQVKSFIKKLSVIFLH